MQAGRGNCCKGRGAPPRGKEVKRQYNPLKFIYMKDTKNTLEKLKKQPVNLQKPITFLPIRRSL